QDQDGAGIDDDLNGCEEFRVERDIESRHVKKHDQQRHRTVDGVAHRDDEHRCGGDHKCKIEKEHLFHHTSSSLPPAGCRQSLPASHTVASQAQAIQPGFCGRCLNATLKNATFGCWSSNCFSRTGNDRSPMASNCSLLRSSCRLSYTDHSNSRVIPRASTGQASTHIPQNRQRVMSM